jgi:glutamate-1-semialdehyde aminotransferase
MLNQGIYLNNRAVGNVSVPMEREELERFVTAWERFIDTIR